MKPPEQWFRPPKFRMMTPTGDHWKYLLIAEPKMGEGVYGVSFSISDNLVQLDPLIVHETCLAARRELDRRIEAGDKHGPGESFDAFRWDPRIVRIPQHDRPL